MKISKFLPYILFVSALVRCQNKHTSVIENYSNGNYKNISMFDSNNSKRVVIEFFEDGKLRQISNYNDSLLQGEQLNFYENGVLESKVFFKQNQLNGVAYKFYESGKLKSSRNYVDGKQNDLGFDYWDYKVVINKGLVRFKNGVVYYKLNFDSSGRPTTQEGDSLHSDVKKLQ